MQERTSKFDASFKIVLLGDSGVGKTSIIKTYLNQQFKDESASTIGFEFVTKIVEYGDRKIQLEIWDTAGQERFNSIAPIYYKKASAVFLVYDITNKASFNKITEWITELEQNGNPNALKIILGNKTDLAENREVPIQDALDFANKTKLKGYDLSAKDVDIVNTVFNKMIKRLIKRYDQLSQQSPSKGSTNQQLNNDEKDEKSSGCCS